MKLTTTISSGDECQPRSRRRSLVGHWKWLLEFSCILAAHKSCPTPFDTRWLLPTRVHESVHQGFYPVAAYNSPKIRSARYVNSHVIGNSGIWHIFRGGTGQSRVVSGPTLDFVTQRQIPLFDKRHWDMSMQLRAATPVLRIIDEMVPPPNICMAPRIIVRKKTRDSVGAATAPTMTMMASHAGGGE